MSLSPQESCLIKTSTILKKLKEDGFANIPSSLILEWSTLSDPHSLPAALILVDRLQFLWTTIEQWKVSLAWNYNALLIACGCIYQGHDFGWIRSPAQLRGQNLLWFLNSTADDSVKDTPQVASVQDRYHSLLLRGRDLHIVTAEFRNSMSHIFGPMLSWIPSFPISNRTFTIPSLHHYHVPKDATCDACSSTNH
jgi:hypothetical protein